MIKKTYLTKSVCTLLCILMIMRTLCFSTSISRYSGNSNSKYVAVGFISKDQSGQYDVEYISSIRHVQVFADSCIQNNYEGTMYRMKTDNRRFVLEPILRSFDIFYISNGIDSHYGFISNVQLSREYEEVIWATN